MTLPPPDVGQARQAVFLDILARWVAADHQLAAREARHAHLFEVLLFEAHAFEARAGEAQGPGGPGQPAAGTRLAGLLPPGTTIPRQGFFGPDALTGAPARGLDVGPVRPAVPVTRALDVARPQELRYFLVHCHYRQALAYSDSALENAAFAYQQIEQFVRQAADDCAPAAAAVPAAALPLSFIDAMDDDLSVPAALASVHATVHDGNYAISSGDRESVATSLAYVRSMLGVLGLDPLDPYRARREINR
ncbi:MAG TPA: DALR domain-containing protein [Trebonia sp.]|jgi:hypothetical protein|nr:DALR domain-containing protein [Trebonia sp.]